MKKYLVIIAIIISVLCFSKSDEIIIPNESIRFRIIANSNSLKDQTLKKKIVSSLKDELTTTTIKTTNLENARKEIKDKIPTIENTINQKLQEENYNKSININYGKNYFPKKVYKGVTYQEGDYESLVVTIGDGMGENFWCVLFPPLCKIDDDATDIEYSSLIKEILNKYKK